MASGAFRTLWQSLEQVWLPQGRARPQDLPQGAGFEAWQGQSEVSWPPRQVTGTGASHGRQSVAWTKTLGPLSSHGPAGLEVSSSLIVTLSWQGAAHLCPQPSSLSQGNLQTGHGPEWHGCGARASWWQLVGAEQGFLHLGGRVIFSRPQGTLTLVAPHAHRTSTSN